MTDKMDTIKDICREYGINQTKLASRFGIPLRTIQNWHGGQRTPPDYVVNMMEELLRQDAKKPEETHPIIAPL